MEIEKFRAWAEIDLDALLSNHRAVKARVGDAVMVCAVVKADAYGHGAVRVAKLLEKEADCFAVAMAEEAFELRQAGIQTPIMILGAVPDAQILPLLKENIQLTVATFEGGMAIAKAAQASGIRADIHLALDTGMGRIGFVPGETSLEEIKRLSAIEVLNIKGNFSHLARADEEDLSFSIEQRRRFEAFVFELGMQGVSGELLHLFNSSAVCNMEDGFDMVREGIVLYGLPSSKHVHTEALPGLSPVMTVKARIAQVKTVPAGTPISYGSTYVTEKERKVATVSIGYGDGVPRHLSNCGEMLVRGKRAKILGRVCMDQLMLDVSHIVGVKIGDEVEFFGKDLTCTEQADICGTINYELLCAVNRRVPRVYIKDGRVESISNILPERF